MRNVILVRNLNNQEDAKRIEQALSQTRTDYEVNLEKQCVVIEGNTDMVAVARKVINEWGCRIL